MELTEIRIKLVEDRGDRLQGFATITFGGEFVVRDLKIIEGTRGPFVAMPSRKLSDRCPKCRAKNHLRARFCNECGARLDEKRGERRQAAKGKLHADIAHPINSECRARIQERVLEAFHEENEKAKEPGYRPASFDDEIEDIYETDAGTGGDAAPAGEGGERRERSRRPRRGRRRGRDRDREARSDQGEERDRRPAPERPAPERRESAPEPAREPVAAAEDDRPAGDAGRAAFEAFAAEDEPVAAKPDDGVEDAFGAGLDPVADEPAPVAEEPAPAEAAPAFELEPPVSARPDEPGAPTKKPVEGEEEDGFGEGIFD